MTKILAKQTDRKLIEGIKSLLHEARRAVTRNINTAMVLTYFEIGRMIVEESKPNQPQDYFRITQDF